MGLKWLKIAVPPKPPQKRAQTARPRKRSPADDHPYAAAEK